MLEQQCWPERVDPREWEEASLACGPRDRERVHQPAALELLVVEFEAEGRGGHQVAQKAPEARLRCEIRQVARATRQEVEGQSVSVLSQDHEAGGCELRPDDLDEEVQRSDSAVADV